MSLTDKRKAELFDLLRPLLRQLSGEAIIYFWYPKTVQCLKGCMDMIDESERPDLDVPNADVDQQIELQTKIANARYFEGEL